MVTDISISYHNEEIAEEVRMAFNRTPLYCKKSLEYKGSIKAYREKLGSSQCVVLIICNDYLKSPECLAELLEIYKNRKFRERIYPIILKGAKITDPHYELECIGHIEKGKQKIEKGIRALHSRAKLTSIYEHLDSFEDWRGDFSRIIQILRDIRVVSVDELQKTNYRVIVDAIHKEFGLSNDVSISSDLIKLTPEGKEVYSGRTYYKDPVFSKFIFLNRDTPIDKIKSFYRQYVDVTNINTPIYQVKFAAHEKADWLFDRLYYEIIEENSLCEYYDKITIWSNLSLRDFKNDVKRKYGQVHQASIKTGEDVLKLLPPDKFHLLPFVIDAESEDKQLDIFIDEFYKFWEKKPSNINCLILLAVNIGNAPKGTFLKWFRRIKPLRVPNLEHLNPINQNHIDNFFLRRLERPQFKHTIDEKEVPIGKLWSPISVQICKALMQK